MAAPPAPAPILDPLVSNFPISYYWHQAAVGAALRTSGFDWFRVSEVGILIVAIPFGGKDTKFRCTNPSPSRSPIALLYCDWPNHSPSPSPHSPPSSTRCAAIGCWLVLGLPLPTDDFPSFPLFPPRRKEDIWTALNIEVLRGDEGD
ncbi:hypothetical protein PR048_006021 [Dryococelus australis]|uniref:Uncharacterized protein n=1 Tax=Dryococelus australis TaxID=614101 RepID=A0ABQ9I9U3_9NEOP|nr:hypothetical protein PR048_006021 [Dryococelus australis]